MKHDFMVVFNGKKSTPNLIQNRPVVLQLKRADTEMLPVQYTFIL
jgi:hypothetical protein